MKRFLLLILSACLCLMFTLSGCSCTGEAILEFNSAQVKSIKSEILTYSVDLEKNYKDIKRSATFNENLLPEYRNGQYQSQYQTGISSPVNNINLSQSESVISRIRTSLTLDVIDTKGTTDQSDDKIYKDQIISEVYFYDSAWSYAPIYSKTIVKNTYVANDQTRIEFAHKIYQYTTTYNKDSYVLTKKYYNADEGEVITDTMDLDSLDENKLVDITGSGSSYKYEFRHVLDNAQLIFATRNLSISKGSNTIIPVVSYMYNNPSKLEISYSSNAQYNFDKQAFNYFNPTFNKTYDKTPLQLPVKNIRITLSNTDYIGLPKYVVVQNDTADDGNIKNNSLVVEYAESVIANASYNCLGALVYRLKDANITYNN